MRRWQNTILAHVLEELVRDLSKNVLAQLHVIAMVRLVTEFCRWELGWELGWVNL